ncbi:uncharacterized protein LOC110736998 isoform X3 [Chenopodium quinoa]|uniref:uncharacterized protein LOC110736998 isoform X3 n=1 Tax=Chenopodium quinoa TaxID=63459 RepID=UPI000B78AC4C|nr:uncharacterized protein LOC110736998 isoform X3 [Chenopodium quinoa]
MVVEYAFATGPSALEELYRDPLNYINREDMATLATLQEGNQQILCGEGYFKKSKNTYDERYIAFKARLSDEMKNSKITTFDKVNLVFFPVPAYYHYYLFCINFTKKILEVIDNRKLQRHISFKSKYEDFPQTFLKAFAQFLNETQAGNGNSVKEFKIVTKQMPWRNNDNITDCGVYAPKHMESYEGQDDWKIGVNKKPLQRDEIAKLRMEFCGKIVLSEENTCREKVVDAAKEAGEQGGMYRQEGGKCAGRYVQAGGQVCAGKMESIIVIITIFHNIDLTMLCPVQGQ